ncbi:hypothetical protein C9439_02550 [archaeon SCG-AAA382B04]|nr:hypothetical protein C9439_02550 [archaeon SCG-AAA382B04]
MKLKNLKNEEGQSEIIGVILLISIVLIVLSVVQSAYVPNWNKNVEWEHYQDVTDDILNIKSSLIKASSLGDSVSEEIKLGTPYPDRLLFVNPAPASGELRTYDLSLNITNATATNPTLQEIWNKDNQINYTTKGLIYTPHYNYQTNVQSYLIEHTALIRYYQENDVNPGILEQSLLQGKTIRPIMLKRNISKNGHQLESLNIYPNSAPPNTIRLKNLDLTFTTIAPNAWTNYLDPKNNTYVNKVDKDDLDKTILGHNLSQLNVDLNESYNYSLKLSSLSLGEARDVSLDQKELILTTDQREHFAPTTLRARVVDKYNNPVSDIKVTFNSTTLKLDGNKRGTNVSLTSDEDGYVTVGASNTTNPTNKVYAYINNTDRANYQEINYTVKSENYGEQNGGAEINPNGTLVLQASELIKGNDVVELRFSNNGSQDINATRARLNYYYSQGGNPPTSASIQQYDKQNSTNLKIGGVYKSLNPQLEFKSKQSSYIKLNFNNNPNPNDFFVLSFIFEDGTKNTYFIGLRGTVT